MDYLVDSFSIVKVTHILPHYLRQQLTFAYFEYQPQILLRLLRTQHAAYSIISWMVFKFSTWSTMAI